MAGSRVTSLSMRVAVEPSELFCRFLSKLTGPLSSRITDSGGSFDDKRIVLRVAGPAVGGSLSDSGAADDDVSPGTVI